MVAVEIIRLEDYTLKKAKQKVFERTIIDCRFDGVFYTGFCIDTRKEIKFPAAELGQIQSSHDRRWLYLIYNTYCENRNMYDTLFNVKTQDDL